VVDRPTRVDVESSARSALPDADYADAYRASSPAFFAAEAWARAAFERASRGSPTGVGAQQLTWRGLLQLRLGPLGDADRVAGWAILDQAPARLVLGAESWHLVARLIFETTRGSARITTLLRYRNPAGGAVWSALGPVHRRAVPPIFDAARRRLTT
jgi:hypothetical protein